MIRYSTPTITIETDIELQDLTEIWVSFKQDNTILRKTKEQITIDNNIIKIFLTQEETAKFKAYENVMVQVRWLKDDIAGGSNIVSVLFNEVLEDEAIANGN